MLVCSFAGTPLPRALAAILLILAWASPAFGQDLDDFWDEAKEWFESDLEEELLPVEELFETAEEYRLGRETWFGKLVAERWGRDSEAYEKLPGTNIKNLARAKDLYRKVADNYPFSKYAPLAELRVADCHYELEEYEEAAVWYEQFIRRRQRRDEVPYAMYRKGMCSYERMRKSGRDQENAKEAAVTFSLLIDRYPDSDQAAKASEKLGECRKRLAEHEMEIGGYYFKRREYWAAAARFNGVWRTYPGLGFDAEAKYMEAQCYDGLGKKDLAEPMYQIVIDDYPGSEWAGKAAERKAGLSGPGASG